MERCPKDKPTDKIFFAKALPDLEKNWKNVFGGGGNPPPCHRRVKNPKIPTCIKFDQDQANILQDPLLCYSMTHS